MRLLPTIGVALVLCVGSALLIRSFVELADVDPGYDAEGVVTFQLVVPAGCNLVDVSGMLADREQSLPGVVGAAYTSSGSGAVCNVRQPAPRR